MTPNERAKHLLLDERCGTCIYYRPDYVKFKEEIPDPEPIDEHIEVGPMICSADVDRAETDAYDICKFYEKSLKFFLEEN